MDPSEPSPCPVVYKKHLSEPWFTLIKLGIKTCEARVCKDMWKDINVGDTLIFVNNDLGFQRSIRLIVSNINFYPDFHTYLENEGLQNCLPGMDNMNIGVTVYRKYYTVEEEQFYGIVCFNF